MLFLSRGRSPSILMVPGFEEIVKTIHGNIPQIRKPLWLKFNPTNSPYEAPGLPTQWGTGKAWGYLESGHAARKIGVTEEEVVDFLLNHDSHGVEFIGITEDGKEIENDEIYFVPEGDGGFFCKLCASHLKNAQGKSGHKKSNAHQEAVRTSQALARENLATV